MKPSEIIRQKCLDKGGIIKSRQIESILDYLDEQSQGVIESESKEQKMIKSATGFLRSISPTTPLNIMVEEVYPHETEKNLCYITLSYKIDREKGDYIFQDDMIKTFTVNTDNFETIKMENYENNNQ